MKLLVDANPVAMAQFVLREWEKQEDLVLAGGEITTVTQLSSEFQSEELDGDNLLLVEGAEGPLYLVEVEFQSTLLPYMPLRSLEYCARAKKKHWKDYGNLPVLAAVIYLFDDERTPVPLLRWSAPGGRTGMVFDYLSIRLKSLPRAELQSLQRPEFWPLVLLTEGEVDRILVGEMFTELLEQQLYDILPIGHAIASWFLRDADLTWLHKEYQKMYELFKDAPAFQWMEESVRQEERKRADQRVLEERKKALAERKKALVDCRQALTELTAQRFPTLKPLVKAQMRTFNSTERFPQVMLRLSLARDIDEAQDILLSLQGDEEAEQTPETQR